MSVAPSFLNELVIAPSKIGTAEVLGQGRNDRSHFRANLPSLLPFVILLSGGKAGAVGDPIVLAVTRSFKFGSDLEFPIDQAKV
jgi:hypothetical protein